MWNYIKGLIRNGSLLTKFLFGSFVFVAVMTLLAIFGTAGKDSLPFLAIGGFSFFKKYKNRVANYFKNIETVPYWGNKFGLDLCIRLLSEDKFKPYVNKKGRKVRGLEVSESGRWFCIKGQYYPTYLVYDYNGATGDITMIDGTQVRAGDWRFDSILIGGLMEYLNADRTLRLDNAHHTMISTGDCARAFKRIYQGNYQNLATADWDEFRYRWEKELSEIEVRNMNAQNSKDHAKALRNKRIADEALHSRVLMDEEIHEIAYAINQNMIKDFSEWFRMEAFKDDMCICNGVKLLKNLGYPANKVGAQFLFDCLKDIQKPYFEEAVAVLEKYPHDELVARIESSVETAHATGDVLWGAGLIYLSKRIGYEISLAKEEAEAEPMVMSQGKF
ncbi:hypothetical protein [Butyrivibrio sp. VCB2001]|uniref:hypothetical protein n=1 Tax=Butyrivibrio sp. VCB2001 TaxID=1280667 RepID=UPI000427F9E4|nr:hypothetical protein [Butyrivibrio sp. VCB2001]